MAALVKPLPENGSIPVFIGMGEVKQNIVNE
jgi:hypothetical protein